MSDLVDALRAYKAGFLSRETKQHAASSAVILAYRGRPTDEEIVDAAKVVDPKGYEKGKPLLSLTTCQQILAWRDVWQDKGRAVVIAHREDIIPYIITHGAGVQNYRSLKDSIYSWLYEEPDNTPDQNAYRRGLWIRLKPEWVAMQINGNNRIEPQLAKLTVDFIPPLRIMGRVER